MPVCFSIGLNKVFFSSSLRSNQNSAAKQKRRNAMIHISPLWSNLFRYLLPAAGLIPCPSLIYLSGQVPDRFPDTPHYNKGATNFRTLPTSLIYHFSFRMVSIVTILL